MNIVFGLPIFQAGSSAGVVPDRITYSGTTEEKESRTAVEPAPPSPPAAPPPACGGLDGRTDVYLTTGKLCGELDGAKTDCSKYYTFFPPTGELRLCGPPPTQETTVAAAPAFDLDSLLRVNACSDGGAFRCPPMPPPSLPEAPPPSGDVLGQEVDAGAQELSEEEPCAWEVGRRHRCEEEPAQQGLVTALVVILVVFLVVILVFFLVQTGFLKRKRGGKKMTGVDDLVRTSSA